MADERISEEELMDRWSISPTGLDRLIEDGHLKVKSEEEGTRYFDSYEIESVEAMKGGRDFVSAREAVEELGIPEDDLENAVDSGAATLYRFGDEARYARNRLEELRDKMGADVEDSSDKTQAINEDELFDFGDEIDAELGLEEEEEDLTESDLISGPVEPTGMGSEEEEEEEEISGEEEEVAEADMITEVVDVSGLEAGEEDLLGDIIEDVGSDIEDEAESTGDLVGEETVDMDTGQEATADITELDAETIDETWDEGQRTADITQLEEETFEGEELEDILAGEEELHGEVEEEEDFDVPYGAPVATEAEAPVSTWVVLLLVVVVLAQVLAAIFVAENVLQPERSTGLAKHLNIFAEKAE